MVRIVFISVIAVAGCSLPDKNSSPVEKFHDGVSVTWICSKSGGALDLIRM